MSTLKSFYIEDGDGHFIQVDTCDRAGLVHGKITSNLKVEGRTMDEEDVAFNAAIDGLESLILAHACAGVDIEGVDYTRGVLDALTAIENHF